MTTLIDTSAFLAVLDDQDPRYDAASRWLDQVAARDDEELVAHSYVVTETIALLHRRFGIESVRGFVDNLLPVCTIRFVDEQLHTRAISAFLAGSSRRPSFVDRVSFELMRTERISRAFAFGRDFQAEGFEAVP